MSRIESAGRLMFLSLLAAICFIVAICTISFAQGEDGFDPNYVCPMCFEILKDCPCTLDTVDDWVYNHQGYVFMGVLIKYRIENTPPDAGLAAPHKDGYVYEWVDPIEKGPITDFSSNGWHRPTVENLQTLALFIKRYQKEGYLWYAIGAVNYPLECDDPATETFFKALSKLTGVPLEAF